MKPLPPCPNTDAGVHSDPGLPHEELAQLRIVHVQFSAIQPEQIGPFGLDEPDTRADACAR